MSPLRFSWAGWAVVGALAAPAAVGADVHVHVSDFAFDPQNLTVLPGDAVAWHNHDEAAHTATHLACPEAGGPGPCEFHSGDLATGATFVHSFAAPGLFDYMCIIHGFFGSLVVDDPATVPDLVVLDVRLAALPPPDGVAQSPVDVDVVNQGDDAAAATRLHVEYASADTAGVVGDGDVGALAPGEVQTVRVFWSTAGKVGDFTLQADADSTASVGESDEANNRLARTVSVLAPPGTVSGVDVLDPA